MTTHPPGVVQYDDATARGFEPFATTRPGGELRAGALLVRERWAMTLGGPVDGFVSAPHLAGFREFDAPLAVPHDATLPPGTIVVNTRALPRLAAPAAAPRTAQDAGTQQWRIGNRVAAVRLRRPLAGRVLADGRLTLDALAEADGDATGDTSPGASAGMVATLDGVWMDGVWDLIRHLDPLLRGDLPTLAMHWQCEPLAVRPDVTVIGDHPVWIERGASVEPQVVLDTRAGPILLRHGATVQAFTRLAGPCIVGRDATILGGRVSGSSIGDLCRVSGELSASILLGHANKAHDGFVGHSVLGRWVNLGAGTTTSNLKNTYGPVALWTPDGVQDTGLQFLGTLLGDHAKTGIGLRLTTGCVIGAGSNVVDAMPPKAVAPFSWGGRVPYDLYALPKFVETAERVMARRQVPLDDAQRRHLDAVYAHATADARWPRR
jgi:UDP-N-acetylglucosamine diphosphorylase/glucosamine-1-phosphate N-acetyltransferase